MNVKVPSFDLYEQNNTLYDEIMDAIGSIIRSGQLIMGPDLIKLEEDLAIFCQTKYAFGVSNGSDALYLALLAADIGEGDEVITTPFTFFATASSIVRTGAKPVFCDIDPKTFNIDPNLIVEKITKNTKAILPVHLYGQVAPMKEINEIAKKHNLIVIEDAAQALGASISGQPACSLGDLACVSFYPTKNLGAFGEAGMIFTNNDSFAEKILLLRVHGSPSRYQHDILGFNCRMDTIQAAILNVKLKYFKGWLEKRSYIADLYDKGFKDTEKIITPFVSSDMVHTYHQYTIRVENRDEVAANLAQRGIQTMIYYPKALHLQPVFQNLGYKKGDFPIAEKACEEVLSLPMFPELSEEQIAYVISNLKECITD